MVCVQFRYNGTGNIWLQYPLSVIQLSGGHCILIQLAIKIGIPLMKQWAVWLNWMFFSIRCQKRNTQKMIIRMMEFYQFLAEELISGHVIVIEIVLEKVASSPLLKFCPILSEEIFFDVWFVLWRIWDLKQISCLLSFQSMDWGERETDGLRSGSTDGEKDKKNHF